MGELVQMTWRVHLIALCGTGFIHLLLLYLLYTIPAIVHLSMYSIGYGQESLSKTHSLCAVRLQSIRPIKQSLSSTFVASALPAVPVVVAVDKSSTAVSASSMIVSDAKSPDQSVVARQMMSDVINESTELPSVKRDIVAISIGNDDTNNTKYQSEGNGYISKTKKRRISLSHIARGFMSYVNERPSSRIVTCGIELQCNQKQFAHRARIALSFYEEQMANFIVQLGNEYPYNGLAPVGSFAQALVKLTADGSVEQVSMLQASGYPDFDRHTLAVLSQATGRYPLLPSITGLAHMVIVVRFFCGAHGNELGTIYRTLGNA